MEERCFIKINCFGKTRYFSHIDGLHTGRKKNQGFETFDTKKEARKRIRQLKTIFHSGFEYTIMEHKDLPFIKKQLKKK